MIMCVWLWCLWIYLCLEETKGYASGGYYLVDVKTGYGPRLRWRHTWGQGMGPSSALPGSHIGSCYNRAWAKTKGGVPGG